MYERIEPLLANTTCEARVDENGETISYRIKPAEGYKLHEITLDEKATDENGNETEEIKKGFTKSYITAGADYDFEKNEREIYSVED